MENANPPPTNNRPVLPAALRARAVQKLHELHKISAFVDSRLESIERFLNNFANQPNETNMNDLESDDESIDTPLIYPFPHSNNDSDDGEVHNELIEYGNVGMLRRERAINSFDGDDLAFQCNGYSQKDKNITKWTKTSTRLEEREKTKPRMYSSLLGQPLQELIPLSTRPSLLEGLCGTLLTSLPDTLAIPGVPIG
ncbi:hypothetical protein Tco_1053731 [Tanacetum coccineum]|uniref:Uncharacterized protein n=1 Tax=Tanacetum coccineum TaxID=301880 RepID=A0ABQ5GV68_9ASTR